MHLLVSGTEAEPCGCPAGFSRCAGRCLKLLDQPANYDDAVSACGALGAHLAVPRSEAEHQCTLNIAATQEIVWIGVTEITTEDNVEAVIGDDGLCGTLPVSETWWKPEEPDNLEGIENCVVIVVRNQAWHDTLCSNVFRPLCQLSSCYRPDECP